MKATLWICVVMALFQQSRCRVERKSALKTEIIDVPLLVMFFSAQRLEHLFQEFRSLQDTLAEVCPK